MSCTTNDKTVSLYLNLNWTKQANVRGPTTSTCQKTYANWDNKESNVPWRWSISLDPESKRFLIVISISIIIIVIKMSVRILAFVLVASAAYGNPVPQQESSSTPCPEFETYNPYLDQCVEFASVDSCGLLGVTCQSGEWCSNANNWTNPGRKTHLTPSMLTRRMGMLSRVHCLQWRSLRSIHEHLWRMRSTTSGLSCRLRILFRWPQFERYNTKRRRTDYCFSPRRWVLSRYQPMGMEYCQLYHVQRQRFMRSWLSSMIPRCRR